MPDYLPLPVVPPSELRRIQHEISDAGAKVRAQPLHFEVRAVGEAFRQLGRASHQGEALTAPRRQRFRELVRLAREKSGDVPLLRLRAVQTELFQSALRQWEQSCIENDELVELGGDFIAFAATHRWYEGALGSSKQAVSTKQRCQLALSEIERAALFISRWTELGMPEMQGLPVAPAWRLLALRARLRLPIAKLEATDLHLIDQLVLLDPSYPELLAKGILYLGLNEPAHAREALRTHLQLHPDGPYALRARNHLVYALERMDADGS